MDPYLEELGRGCIGKKRYSKESLVLSVIAKAEAKRGTPLRHYSCGLCGGWHISKKPSFQSRF